MTRITDLNQHNTMVSYLMRAADQEARTQEQIASGKKITTFADLPGDTGVLMSAKRTEANLTQYTRTANEVLNRLGLQDIQMREMEQVSADLRQLFTQAVAAGSALNFTEELDGLFQRFVSLLNSSVDGKYVYSGTRTNVPPVNIVDLTDLSGLASVSDAFDNNTLKQSINIDDDEKVQFGFLASDMASDIFQTLKDLMANPLGPFDGALTPDQSNFLKNEIGRAGGLIDSAMAMTSITAANGRVARQVENAVVRHEESQVFIKTFIGHIEDVDLADAVSRLTMNQLQSQATARVVSQLTKLSLLDYI